jgi:hypothetical protein
VDAPDFVEATLMVQAGRKLVHLVNLPVGKPLSTGWRQIARNIVPVANITVALTLGAGEHVREARLATSEAMLPVRQEHDRASIVVPHLADHEIVIFEMN